jgi:hypothetical protein
MRLPVGARHALDRVAWHFFRWGTNGSIVHAVVFARRRGNRAGHGAHRHGLPTDASGRLDVDRELEERRAAARGD